MLRLFEVYVQRSTVFCWFIGGGAERSCVQWPLELYYDRADPDGPYSAPCFYGAGRSIRYRRTTVRTKAEWDAARRRWRDDPSLPDVNWLDLKADSAWMLQNQHRLGDLYDPKTGRWTSEDPEAEKIWPGLRVLCFDVETSTLDPADADARILTIAAALYRLTPDGATCLDQAVFNLGSCDDRPSSWERHFLDGATPRIYTYHAFGGHHTLDPSDHAANNRERKLIGAFTHFVVRCDPDLIAGHNIENFDVHYVVERLRALSYDDGLCPEWGRALGGGDPSPVFPFSFEGGKQTKRTTTLPGRAYFDTYIWSRKQIGKERSYRLNALAPKYCGPDAQKDDMPYDQIVPAWLSGHDGRTRLALYCLQDVHLTMRYALQRKAFNATYAMARHTHLTLTRFLGQSGQAFIYSTFCHYALVEGYFLPWARREIFPKTHYEGGAVFPVKPGFHEHYVITIDFKSLYPSEEISRNMCASTLVFPEDEHRFTPEQVWTCPAGNVYLKPEVKVGLTAMILRIYLSLRGHFKRLMRDATTDAERASADSAQQATKQVCNTVYGAFGCGVEQGGKLPCLPIAVSTTAQGRADINMTDRIVAERWGRLGVQRIGGDTDSLILHCPVERIRPCLEEWRHADVDPETATDDQVIVAFGRAVVAALNPHYVKPMEIELDDIFKGFVYVSKKHYAGSYFKPGPDGLVPMASPPGDVKIQGLECKRMDNPPVVSDVQFHAIRVLLDLPHHPTEHINPPPPCRRSCEAVLRWAATGVCQNVFPLEAYVIEKELTKPTSEYQASLPPHVSVAKRLEEKHPRNPPRVHDRIGYVIVRDRGQQVPVGLEEAKERQVPVDRLYYVERLMSEVYMRTFGIALGQETVSDLLRQAKLSYRVAPVKPDGIWKSFVKP